LVLALRQCEFFLLKLETLIAIILTLGNLILFPVDSKTLTLKLKFTFFTLKLLRSNLTFLELFLKIGLLLTNTNFLFFERYSFLSKTNTFLFLSHSRVLRTLF